MISGRTFVRVHGWFLAVLGTLLLTRAVQGHLQGAGMFAFLAENDVAAIGFVEAYGLVAIAGAAIGLGAASPRRRPLHLLAAGLHVFLATINVTHWRFYAALNMGAAGYASTAMHVVLALVELAYAGRSSDPRPALVSRVEG